MKHLLPQPKRLCDTYKFVYLLVSLQAELDEKLPADLAEIFREG